MNATGLSDWRRRPSYLGADQECRSCHGEFHGEASKTSLNSCERCRNVYGWEKLNPTLDFDHTKETSFALDGRHLETTCSSCHLGKQKFGPLPVSGCETCHSDPHPEGIFGELKCDDCHVTSSFVGRMNFDHAKTGWSLTGETQRSALYGLPQLDEVGAGKQPL